MNKTITCIECPNGCILTIDIEEGCIVNITGNQCDKGKVYAVSEIQNPVRILTSTVLTQDQHMKMVPVRTDRPIPKSRLFDAMDKIKKVRLADPVHAGDVIIENFLGLDVNLIAVRNS